jgi:Fic family protein
VARLLVDQKLLINLMPILESKSSSEIENIVTTTDELFRYAGDEDNATPAVKETLRYKQAMFTGFSLITGNGSRPFFAQTLAFSYGECCQRLRASGRIVVSSTPDY